MTSAELRELARLHGIQLTYEDAAGKKRTASRESLEAVLRAFPEAPPAREPVVVVWGDAKPKIKIDGRYRITLESGETISGKDAIDRPLPYGYHTLKVGREETMLFVAPRRAPEPGKRMWGAFAPLYALHSKCTWGIGDLGDLRRLQQWTRGEGAAFVGTLPLNAIFAEQDPSPYAPISRLFWNEMYLDVRALPEYGGGPRSSAAAEDGGAPLSERVDYPAVMRAKRALLLEMSHRFFDNPDDGFASFATYANDYALFRSRMESTAGLWRDWADEDEFSFDAVRYHLYVQYRMEQQLCDLEGLYLDFPLGVHANGYDAWRFDDHFARGVSVGAPPDLFFKSGQNWGFPPLHPEESRVRHHEYFRECIRRQLTHASMLRIDHVMALHRLFWIPEGMEPKDGVYVRYPEDELYAILMIEAHRANAVIIGEDLGTVPQYVPKTMEKRGVHRMFVVQYEEKLKRPPVHSLACINTHDMPTFARYAAERGLLRKDLDEYLRFLADSSAEIVLVNLEDLWGEEEPQNVPGKPERSWRHRMRLSLEEMQKDAAVKRALRIVDEGRKREHGNEE